MKELLIKYINEVVGFQILVHQLDTAIKGTLPLYLRDAYQWYEAEIESRQCLFAVVDHENYGGINQLGKHFNKVKEITKLPVIAVFDSLEAYNRKRLIEKKIAFVVPNKQLYIPEFIIDIREYNKAAKKKKGNLTPMAQQILILFILDKYNKLEIEKLPFKDLAGLLNTNPMSITRAVESLKNQELIEITGEKEKTIHFIDSKRDLWMTAKKHNIFINPVIKRVFIDKLPQNINLLKSNDNALTEYTDINPTHQEYFAIENSIFQALKRTNALINENNYDGKYCIEVWKYNPLIINKLLFETNQIVDPLSLLLCYKDTYDERVEMALEQIENKYLW